MYSLKKTSNFIKWESQLKDRETKAKITARLYRLENGLLGDVSPVGNGISELRIHYGSGYRIYFKQYEQEIIILLCGGNKSTQSRDIEAAKKLLTKLDNKHERETLSF